MWVILSAGMYAVCTGRIFHERWTYFAVCAAGLKFGLATDEFNLNTSETPDKPPKYP